MVPLGLTAGGAQVLAAVARGLQPGFYATLNDVWGGLVGDRVRHWRTKRLVLLVEGTVELLKSKGIDPQNARALPDGELFQIFEGASKCTDDEVSSLWSGLLASALDPNREQLSKTRVANVLSRMDGESAVLFRLLAEFRRARGLDFDPELVSVSASSLQTEDERSKHRARLASVQEQIDVWNKDAEERLRQALTDNRLLKPADQESATLMLVSLGLIRLRPRSPDRLQEAFGAKLDYRDAPGAVAELDKRVRKIADSENDRDRKPALEFRYQGVQRNYILTKLGVSVADECGLEVEMRALLD